MEHLDPRKESILRRIVEVYVADGEPVGSKSVATTPNIDVSSATIRNEMSVLEREGYISQPHSSAGRIPTDKGYRYYVDQLVLAAPSDSIRVREIELNLASAMNALEDVLRRASTLLSELTTYTSIASSPPAIAARLRGAHVVPLGGRRLFLLAVGDGGWHAEQVIDVVDEPSASQVSAVSELIERSSCGRTTTEAADALDAAVASGAVDQHNTAIVTALTKALRAIGMQSARTYAGGTARLVAWEPAPIAQKILELIESPMADSLLPQGDSEGVSVRIGRELGFEYSDDLALIAAGYRLGQQSGVLGVIGPSRMDYPDVISAVADVAQSLSRALQRIQ